MIDLHNRLGVWTLPFHFSNALTGAILGLASVLALAIAAAGFDNDTEAVFAPVFGSEPEAAAGRAEQCRSGRAARLHGGANIPNWDVTYLILHDPGTAGQHINIIAEHTRPADLRRLLQFSTPPANFRAMSGSRTGLLVNRSPARSYNVHFGNWGGRAGEARLICCSGLILCRDCLQRFGDLFRQARRARGTACAATCRGMARGRLGARPRSLRQQMAAAADGAGGRGSPLELFWGGLAVLVRCLCPGWGTERAMRCYGDHGCGAF